MNLFVIKEVWFRYIFSNQQGSYFNYGPLSQNWRMFPVSFYFLYDSGDSTREYNY
ncbi:hypothetical protein LEP1GSC074_1600 [Leptospira noguchii str. Hook]|nr:hypothetical protein LEP1GSC041_4566 [Leptospira noguchii str. 2006001870]EMS82887.1 hypothetical protein LEP1GSC074_1600 [Leptospira noguchii str. Hook]